MSRFFSRVRAVISNWQCFACNTWNDDSSNVCMCGYDPYGFDTA